MNDIDRLKELLFGNEKKALDAITRRLEIPESRTADISDVLPEALLRSHASDPRLSRALEEPVEQCIKNSIRKDPADFADALFPIMGPAIRKAIADALRSMTQSLNQAIENSLSVQTRYRAWRAGVPLGQYILQRNLLYRVEQAFLIKRFDGLLIEHVHHENALSKDTDAVSAMFTAIQDFIQDSFEEEIGESLTTAVLGDLTLWAVHGPHAVLVCVIRGVPPVSLRTELSEILEKIHLSYGDALAGYDGDAEDVAGVELELEKCLLLEQRNDDSADKPSKRPIAALVVFGLLALLLGWWLWSSYVAERHVQRFRAALESVPGLVINDVRRQRGSVVVRGLRDPLAASPVDFAPAASLDPADVELDMAPYQSLDADIVLRRARQILAPPSGVNLQLDDDVLRVAGSAPPQWQQRAETIAAAIPGVRDIDMSGVATSGDDAALAAATAALAPPPGVSLSVSDGLLVGSGSAPQAWIEQAARVGDIAGVRSVDLSRVTADESVMLRRLLDESDGTDVFFSRADILAAGQDAVLDRLVRTLMAIGQTAAALGRTPRITVTGHADGTGTRELNNSIEERRAQRIARWLTDAGIPAAWVGTRSAAVVTDGVRDPARRKAVINVSVQETGN